MMNQVRTDADLDNCIFFQTVIEVSFAEELADVGFLQHYTDLTVKINGNYYFRNNITIIMK